MNGTPTDNKQIMKGSLQGSILEPFLFLLYMSDLDASSGDSKVTKFADDRTLMSARNIID